MHASVRPNQRYRLAHTTVDRITQRTGITSPAAHSDQGSPSRRASEHPRSASSRDRRRSARSSRARARGSLRALPQGCRRPPRPRRTTGKLRPASIAARSKPASPVTPDDPLHRAVAEVAHPVEQHDRRHGVIITHEFRPMERRLSRGPSGSATPHQAAPQRIQPQLRRRIRHGRRRIRVALDEQGVHARRRGRPRQQRGPVGPSARLLAGARRLGRVRHVKAHRRRTALCRKLHQVAEPEKIVDQTVIPERRATLREHHVRTPRLGQLADRTGHLARGQKLPLLDVHRPPMGSRLTARRGQEVGLAAQERRDLDEIDHPCRGAGVHGLVDIRRRRNAKLTPDRPIHSSPRSSPGPRADRIDDRFALSYEALKISGRPASRHASRAAVPTSIPNSYDSSTHGPAITARGREGPIDTGPTVQTRGMSRA